MTRDEYIPTLDGWRAVAIGGVTVAHATFAIFREGGTSPNATLFAATRYGALGVDLFFAISGFLICSRLAHEFEQRNDLDLRRFYIRRVFRIVPPYLVTLLTVSLLGAAGLVTMPRREFWSCLLFLRNYLASSSEYSGWYTAHFWSLSVEEHFYLLWPTLLLAWTPVRGLRNVAILACAIAVWRAVDFRLHVVPLGFAPFFTRTDIRIDALLWGCFAALLLRDSARREQCRRWLTPAVWCAAVALYAMCAVFLPPFAMTWEAMLAPVIVIGTVLNPHAVIGRLLEMRALRWVGRMSYSFYLWQTPFFGPGTPTGVAVLQTFPWNVCAAFGAAAVSYYAIERPMIRIGHRLTARSSVPAAMARASEAPAF